ncbi:hypothetical protein DV737_g4697, partial [Chaetothyriales sp. CBS 132003]
MRCRIRSVIDLKRRARARWASSISNQAQSRWALLSNKRLIRLSGPDAANFLHNIIPAKILGVGTTPIYTVFLSAQGRILQDVFIYPPSWEGEKKQEWLIEVDADSASDLFKHLKKHKLRAKFAMELVDDQEAAVCLSKSSNITQGIRAGGNDPRPGMGTRLVLNHELQHTVRCRIDHDHDHDGQTDATPPTVDVPLEQYTIHRMLNGLAEGQKEIISGHALPQECNIDFLGGIDFHKGCYLGQELTIRTHHTGVVRKRILPCQIYDEKTAIPPKEEQNGPIYDEGVGSAVALPPLESNISKLTTTKRGRSTGKWLGGVANIGLALCRLEMMTDIQLTAETTTATYSPDDEYHSLHRKERRKPGKQQQQLDDDDEELD